LDWRNLGLARDLGNATQIGTEFVPPPQMRKRLHLVGGDAAGSELASAFTAGLAEPRTLGRRIGLGTHPDIVLGGLGVDRVHHLARFVGKRNLLLRGGCDGGHDVCSCRRAAVALLVSKYRALCPSPGIRSRPHAFGAGYS